ncbi:thymidine phosphorylase family protein [Spartinivicinus ruber]|uniref:thymidine phosphorylase family protein n=1 Tax=Spartinivicinus ruber TaxID=2683272 RepID=UPI0013D02FDB|nr:thymidine phosphorylase family protein [Spartinivicinus ruber]
MEAEKQPLRLRRIGIDTHQEPVAYLRQDSHVCKSEGFSVHSRIKVATENHSIIATIQFITSQLLTDQEIGLSEAAWTLLKADEGEQVHCSHAKPADSFTYIKSKLAGKSFDEASAFEVMHDICLGHYPDIQLATYLGACSGTHLSPPEVIAITKAMVDSGQRIDWDIPQVLDKHCVGGVPGNRTSPLVVAIVAAAGLTMPKTSSRAITSPAGTVDTMEVMTPVNLSLKQIQQVVEQESGCLVWGGSVSLCPADDILLRVQRALNLDSEGQMVASVLAKKIAAGSSHVLIDIPIGPTAKIKNQATAFRLQRLLVATGEALGIEVTAMTSDGNQPIGFGVGPALEARDVLAVLRCEPDAPVDLAQRALTIAGKLLEMGGKAEEGDGYRLAQKILNSGAAEKKFIAICEAQGGFTEPPVANNAYEVTASHNGIITYIDNRFIARLAHFVGAPAVKTAGLEMQVKLGDQVTQGQPLFTLHSEATGELSYALEFLQQHPNAIRIEETWL